MTDTKISALTGATTPLGSTDIVPVVQSSTSKKATVEQIARAFRTVKVLAADQANNTVTPASVHTDLEFTLTTGTYIIDGVLVWKSAALTTGIELFFNANGGAVTRINVLLEFPSTGTSANLTHDLITTSASGQVMEARAQRANNTTTGATTGVDTANAEQLFIVFATIIVTSTTTLQLMMASEVAASAVTMLSGSTLTAEKVA